jgi:hypothetical protein
MRCHSFRLNIQVSSVINKRGTLLVSRIAVVAESVIHHNSKLREQTKYINVMASQNSKAYKHTYSFDPYSMMASKAVRTLKPF